MATVVKNFRIKSGLVVEGTSGTINGHNILTESTSGDQYILNLVGGSTLVKSVDTSVFNVDNAGNLTLTSSVVTVDGEQTLSNKVINNPVIEGQTSFQENGTEFVNIQRSYTGTTRITSQDDLALRSNDGDIILYPGNDNGGTGKAYIHWGDDAYNAFPEREIATLGTVNDAISTEVSDRNSAISSAINTEVTDRNNAIDSAINTEVTNRDNAITNAINAEVTNRDNAIAQAESDANAYADSLINDTLTDSTHAWSSYKTSSEIGVAVANLVDSAPELLDTLNELAAALADNPNYATDMATQLSEKQNNLTAGTGITLIDDEISVTANTYDAYGAAANAQSAAALDATDKANTAQSNAEATAQAALDNVLDGTTPFSDININDIARNVAARTTSLGSVAVTAYQFNRINFKSGKFLVKIDNGTNNEVSEILVTLDSSDNIAISEYAIVGTNGSRGTITADIDNSHARIRVTPVDDSTITVYGTIFKA